MTDDEFFHKLGLIGMSSPSIFDGLENYYKLISKHNFTTRQQKELIYQIFLSYRAISTDPSRKKMLIDKLISYTDMWEDAWMELLTDPSRHVNYYGNKSTLKIVDQMYR